MRFAGEKIGKKNSTQTAKGKRDLWFHTHFCNEYNLSSTSILSRYEVKTLHYYQKRPNDIEASWVRESIQSLCPSGHPSCRHLISMDCLQIITNSGH